MRIMIMHYIGKILGVNFKVDGQPWGAPARNVTNCGMDHLANSNM